VMQRQQFWDAIMTAVLSGCGPGMEYEDIEDVVRRSAAIADAACRVRDLAQVEHELSSK
jgi:hypothetical protein